MRLRPISINLLGFKEWGKDQTADAFNFLTVRCTGSRHVVALWGELGGFHSVEFWQLVQSAVVSGSPRFELCSSVHAVRDKLEQYAESKQQSSRIMLNAVYSHIREGPDGQQRDDWVGLFHTAMKRGIIKLFLVTHDLPGPHFTIVDGHQLLLEQMHQPGDGKPMWFMRHAGPLAWKYKYQFEKIKKSAVPLHEVVTSAQEFGDVE